MQYLTINKLFIFLVNRKKATQGKFLLIFFLKNNNNNIYSFFF